ncbi:MAG: dTDP-4-dehydrorhamnose reductase [Proteobacteria bacterium]|nr:dTDP-4-dehydrorhamnose reductase [Pseudomonadota bacterium]
MRILILGHKGMLGSELMLRLARAHDVAGRDVDAFDLTSENDCRRVVQECSPKVVINAAAYTNVDGCEANREACFAVNAAGVKNIALACRGKGVALVHFSTDYIFDGRKRTPYDEEDPPAALNAYGASKLEGERFLQSLAESYLLIRTAWLYGRHGKNFVKTILEKASTVKTLEVVDDQIGSPTYSRHLAAAVEVLVAGGHRGVFHVTNSGQCSWYEFARTIVEYAGMNDVTVRPIGSDRLSRPAPRPAWSVLSAEKFTAATGRTMPDWRQALREYLGETHGETAGQENTGR